MAKTFLKDSSDDNYLENAGNDNLEAPDEGASGAGRYIVEEDGVPVADAGDDAPYTITIV